MSEEILQEVFEFVSIYIIILGIIAIFDLILSNYDNEE